MNNRSLKMLVITKSEVLRQCDRWVRDENEVEAGREWVRKKLKAAGFNLEGKVWVQRCNDGTRFVQDFTVLDVVMQRLGFTLSEKVDADTGKQIKIVEGRA
jgi:hypothetical protein